MQDPEKFHELLVVAIIKHDSPFQFMGYESIKGLFSCVYEDVKLVVRNNVKTDDLKMYKDFKLVTLHFWKD